MIKTKPKTPYKRPSRSKTAIAEREAAKAAAPTRTNSSPIDPAVVPLPPDGSPEQIALELKYAGEALLDFEQSDVDQKRKIEELKARLASGTINDEIYDTMVSYYEQVLDLEGKLRDSEAAHARDIAAMRADLDAADIKFATAEAVAADALDRLSEATSELTGARKNVSDNFGVVHDVVKENGQFYTEIASLKIQLSREQVANKILNSKLTSAFNRGPIARLLNRAA